MQNDSFNEFENDSELDSELRSAINQNSQSPGKNSWLSRIKKEPPAVIDIYRTVTHPLQCDNTKGVGPDYFGPLLCNRYRLGLLIGEGGFGSVFKSFDLELQREVAVKILKKNRSQSVESFRQDAQIAAKANARESHVVRVHDIGEEGDKVFFVMELASGTLKDQMKDKGSIDPVDTVRIVIQIIRGVESLHRRKIPIIHRDIKPQNVLFFADKSSLDFVYKISDFGLAGPNGNGGTPVYESPEQLAGKEVGIQSDIFSIGIVMTEMISGIAPRLETRGGPLFASHVHVSEDLQWIIQRCLKTEPKQRYQSCGELISDLEKWLIGMPVWPLQGSTWKKYRYYAHKFYVRNLVRIIRVLVLSLLVALAIFVVYAYQSNRVINASSKAVAYAKELSREQNNRGVEKMNASEWVSAELYFDTARKILESGELTGTLEDEYLEILAQVYCNQGRLAQLRTSSNEFPSEAERNRILKLYGEAAKTWKKCMGYERKYSHKVAGAFNNQGVLLKHVDQDEAIKKLSDADDCMAKWLSQNEQIDAKEWILAGDIKRNLAAARLGGRDAKALDIEMSKTLLALYSEAIAYYEKSGKARNPEDSSQQTRLCRDAKVKVAEALHRYDVVIEELEELIESEPANKSIAYQLRLAYTYSLNSNHSEAMRRAIELSENRSLDARSRFNVACTFCVAHIAVKKDLKLSQADKETLSSLCIERAVSLLTKPDVVELMRSNRQKYFDDPDLLVLSSHPSILEIRKSQ